MVALTWDVPGAKLFETGVDKGVLYKRNAQGVYNTGFAWVGLTAVTESPSGAESSKTYADNKVYANITSAEQFDATLEAFTYPDAFMACDGTAELTPGVFIGQQNRETFGLAYRSKVGNDVAGLDYGYKLHLIYGGIAAPSERAYSTINESSDPMPLSWAISTTPVDVAGKKPTAPAEVASIVGTTLTTTAQPTAPTYSSATKQITIPTVTGVDYFIDGVKKTGLVTISKDTVVTATAAPGYKLPAVTDDDWLITYS
jgi:hypothetical protein